MELHERTEKCRGVFSLLSDYLNLELPPDACQGMEAHIAGCPLCIEFAESLRNTVELCRRYQPSELPEPLGTMHGNSFWKPTKKCSAAGKHSRSAVGRKEIRNDFALSVVGLG